MTDPERDRLSRENAHLKHRCAQLQDADSDLERQFLRLQQPLGRLHEGRSAPSLPNPLSGGQ